MARLPRLSLGGEIHLAALSGHNRQAVFGNDDDRARFLSALREAQSRERVDVHAYTLLIDRVWLLLTPPTAEALGRMVQATGRRYTSAFNRLHARTGTLWNGRFRSTLVDAGRTMLEVMVFIEQAAVREGLASTARDYVWSSACHHLGLANDSLITDRASYWALGNTPFERASAYSNLLDEPMPPGAAVEIVNSALKGWALGSDTFIARLRQQTSRPLVPRPRGRPPGS